VEALTHWGEARAPGGGGGARPLAADGVGADSSKEVVGGIGGFITALVDILVDMIVRIGKAIAPAIVMMLAAPLYSIVMVIPDLLMKKFIPALLGAPMYPPRPAGFTGPDPYDPYGPDSPEPRPFPNAGMAMCRKLLEQYTGSCAFQQQ
jgi:hypothetical protein